MNGLAWACVVLAFVFAMVDWFAVAQHRHALEYVCKPAATVAFLATALALDPTDSATRVWFCVALAWCVAGDVFLMLPRDAFVPGLAAFLVAQVCFTAGFASGVDGGALLVGAGVVVAVTVPLATRFARALRRRGDGALVAPVLAYVGAIGAMVATAIGAGVAVGIAGAGLFYGSDALIAETRFVRPRPWGPLGVIVSYHVALAALVLSLVA